MGGAEAGELLGAGLRRHLEVREVEQDRAVGAEDVPFGLGGVAIVTRLAGLVAPVGSERDRFALLAWARDWSASLGESSS